MRSSEVAAETGVNVQTLRYYERRGLLPEPERSDSGYRLYDLEAVRTIRFVKRVQQLGFSLEEVETLLGLAAGGPESCQAARALAVEKLEQLEQKLASLMSMRESLRQFVATCHRSPSRRVCPLLDTTKSDDGPDQNDKHDEQHHRSPGGLRPRRTSQRSRRKAVDHDC